MNWQTVGPAKKDRKRKIEALPACNSAAVFRSRDLDQVLVDGSTVTVRQRRSEPGSSSNRDTRRERAPPLLGMDRFSRVMSRCMKVFWRGSTQHRATTFTRTNSLLEKASLHWVSG
jgi:hypothetical protein